MESNRKDPRKTEPPWQLSVLTAPEKKISSVFDELPHFEREIESFHPIKSAAFVAGLLTIPVLHANAVRIELLVHILMAFAQGEHQPTVHRIDVWLNQRLGGTSHARLEDPVEDVFISNVTTEEGNFRIFEGTWESNDFYLQRVLNIVNTLPDDESSRQLKRQIRAVLKISDEVAARCHLPRFTPGGGKDKGHIPVPSLERLRSHASSVEFSPEDLRRFDVSPEDLFPFVWQLDNQDKVQKQALGNSELTRAPLVYDSANVIVLLPTAISIAVRQHVLKWMYQTGYQKSFDEHLVSEYRQILLETPILGQIMPREMFIPSKQIAGKTFLEFGVEIDAGRYLQIIAIVDSLSCYLNYGFSVSDENVRELTNEMMSRINEAKSYFHKEQRFKQGLTLVIGCGYGRPSYFHTPKETSDWRFEFVSAQDFHFLAWVPEASPLFLWKLVDHDRFIAENGISVFNANGLLNLYGWWSETQYFMLIPEIPFGGDPIKLAIPTNSLANIRIKVRQGWDLHVLPLPAGKYIRVQRAAAVGHFPDEENRPKYGAIDAAINANLLGAWVSERCIWWVSTDHSKTGLSRDLTFRVWDAVIDWLELAAPIIEQRVQEIVGKAIYIILDFNEALKEDVDPVPAHVLASFLVVSTDLSTSTIRIGFKDPFFGGFRNPNNAAEREIIRALATGASRIGGRSLDDKQLDDIIIQIFPNEDARYIHLFEAASFRDYIRIYDLPDPLLIDESDEARTKLGVGWLARNRSEGDRITEADKSVLFLNRVVDAIWERMRPQFQKLDRTDFIERALRHIEGVEADKLRWKRTIRAVLAMRRDKTSAKAVAIKNGSSPYRVGS